MKNKIKFLSILGLFFALLFLLPQVSQAAMQLTQSNVDGFNGDGFNTSTYSMVVFDNRLYAATNNPNTGTEIWSTSNGSLWTQSNIDGFNSDTENEYVVKMIVFKNKLYAATRNTNTGTEIWSTSNGSLWTQSNDDGFDSDANNISTLDMMIFNNNLYATTRNSDTGTQIWSTSNGSSWTQSNFDGFDNDANNLQTENLIVFNNKLYASVWNASTGAQIWSTSTGSGELSWAESNSEGFNGDTNNTTISVMIIFNGRLYAAARNSSTGTEIWSTLNGSTWTQSNSDGFDSDTDNTWINNMVIFNSKLYASVWNNSTGVQIWSTNNGSLWTQSNDDGFDGGIDDFAAYQMSVLGNRLFVSTVNISGTEIWNTNNGSSWAQIGDSGFNGDANNTISHAMVSFNDELFVSSENIFGTGTEIWTLSDVTNPTISNQSPADSSTGVDVGANVSFRTDDEDLGVDSDTLDVTIEGDEAITDGSCQSGYSCSITAYGDNGYNVSINPSTNFDYSREINVEVNIADLDGDNTASSSWSFTTEAEPADDDDNNDNNDNDNNDNDDSNNSNNDNPDTTPTLSPIILTASGPGQPARLQAYSKGNMNGANSLLDNDITGLFPEAYTGGAGIVPIDQSNNGVLDQFVIFARSNGGPQARIMGLKSDGTLSNLGQMFVFDSSIRNGMSATYGDFDNDDFQDDAAFCLTGDGYSRVKIFKDISGIDNWELINQFDTTFGTTNGCNLGTFQYDTGAEELLITPNHGPATPNVYIYTVGGTQKEVFQAYDDPIDQGLTATGIADRIYTTPNNGSSQVNAFNKAGERKNFWWVYDNHVRGDFTIRSAQLDPSTTKQELLISPIGSNGPHILGYQASGIQKPSPNFFAFNDPTLRNGVGIAVIENWHGVN